MRMCGCRFLPLAEDRRFKMPELSSAVVLKPVSIAVSGFGVSDLLDRVCVEIPFRLSKIRLTCHSVRSLLFFESRQNNR